MSDECYRPNAELGNYGHMSWDLGPTLAGWLLTSPAHRTEGAAIYSKALVDVGQPAGPAGPVT